MDECTRIVLVMRTQDLATKNPTHAKIDQIIYVMEIHHLLRNLDL